MSDWQALVRDFHHQFGVHVGNVPELRDHELRSKLIREEATETLDAIQDGDLVEAVDGIADLIYVCLGAAVTWGVDLSPVFDLVHASNMTKTGGVRADGKILKGPGFVAPDVAGELMRRIRAGWEREKADSEARP